MAIIQVMGDGEDRVYVLQESEDLAHNVESTTHPVEKGIDITDHVKRNPIELSISGKIIGYTTRTKCPVCGEPLREYGINQKCAYCHTNLKNLKGHTAPEILEAIKRIQKAGLVVTYTGRNAISNLQIQSFSTSHPYTNTGGCDFSMTLKEVRFAKQAYVPSKNTTNNTGTQQIEQGESTEVYYVVKSGDCVWNLVTGPYKNLDPKFDTTIEKCDWVMSQNPSAFSVQGDFRTLQNGEKILIGLRK